MEQIASQWGLQLIFRMHNSDPTPQGVENRNILLWIKCVLTALHVNCMIQKKGILICLTLCLQIPSNEPQQKTYFQQTNTFH
jgi:hypothetical protein